jgi:hypothetical protein
MKCKHCGKAIVEYDYKSKGAVVRHEHYIKHRCKSRRCKNPEV